MLKKDLVELINERQVWAFIGAGASADAGCPGWRDLVTASLRRLPEGIRSAVETDERFKDAFEGNHYPKCFSRFEAFCGRATLEESVSAVIGGVERPGNLLRTLADWPFAGYVTLNYDSLLETALRERRQLGWLSLSNSTEDLRQLSGDPHSIVWHAHGTLSDPRSMVLTEEDYERHYAEHSPMVTQLRALLGQRRLVYLGFGFGDEEVMRLLRRVGRLSSPARPAFAFLAGLGGSKRLELREKQNIDVIPYSIGSGKHEALQELLSFYGIFLLRRSITFHSPTVEAPAYDPAATSLLTYNELSQRATGASKPAVFELLVRSTILAMLGHSGPMSIEGLRDALAGRIRLLDHVKSTEAASVALQSQADKLIAEGLVELVNGALRLTGDGGGLAKRNSDAALRLEQRFVACLVDRARVAAKDGEDAELVGNTAALFLKDCATRRALGVALSWGFERPDFREYHIVGLLQSLPLFVSRLPGEKEALLLGRVVRDVLARPETDEKKYLGVLLQAHFGINLLGYDPALLETRTRLARETYFLVDSNTLIPFLARSAIGHDLAKGLLKQALLLGCGIGTTPLLACEVAEHARYALRWVAENGSPYSTKTLALAGGTIGHKSNLFVDGFITELEQGTAVADFNRYLEDVVGPGARSGSDTNFELALGAHGVPVRALSHWEGSDGVLFARRDELAGQIADRRKLANSFTHERQAAAEAEAVVIVEQVRNGTLKESGRQFEDAWFVSNSGLLDVVTGRQRPLTMRAQAVFQWLSTLTAASSRQLEDLTTHLLWELSERGLSIVDGVRLEAAFRPFISASQEKLAEEVSRHRAQMSSMYGEAQAEEFAAVRPLDVPVVLESYQSQRADALESELDRQRRAREAAERVKGLSSRERTELELLRAEKKRRISKGRSQRRAAASRPRRGRGRR